MFARIPLLLAIIALCLPPASAEPLHKRMDAEGNVHYGTATDPNLCCMCRPALSYAPQGGRTVFFLRHGLERAVGNERVFISADGRAWYCDGVREMGRATRKCGLVPPLM